MWQPQYYDFNLWSESKRIEKLRYIHRNPVKRGLGGGTARLAVEQLSSLSFRGGRGGRNRVAVDRAKEGADGSHAADRGSKSNSPPSHCKGRSDKDRATSSLEMKGKGWASLSLVKS